MITMIEINSIYEDGIIYEKATINLLNLENPYEIKGFYYFPHFFVFLPIFTTISTFYITAITSLLYCTSNISNKFILILFTFGSILQMIKGNFDIIICLFITLLNFKMNKKEKKIIEIITYIKPQILFVSFFQKKYYKICFLICICSIVLISTQKIELGNFITSFFRPSVLLMLFYKKNE